MMTLKGHHRQAWVTTVLKDEDASNALVLCKSLKRGVTTRRVAVLVSPKVSVNLREILNQVFDYLFYLEEDRNSAYLKDEDFAKVSTFNLLCFEKCVYLSNNTLVMKNCDEIFDIYDNFMGFVSTESSDFSIFLLRPSLNTFKGLMSGLQGRNGMTTEKYLKTWRTNQNKEQVFIDEKYTKVISHESPVLTGNEKDVTIVKLQDTATSLSATFDKLGFIEKLVLEKWMDIYVNDVKSLLKFPEAPLPHLFDKEDQIAIVGMSCRYPAANNLEEFWNLLFEGRDATGNPPSFRWLKDQCIRNGADYRKTNGGFLAVPVDDFDAKFFGISPKEALCMDPQHRLLHELIWEGLEDAAIDPQSLRGTKGSVFMGSWTNDYRDILSHSGNNEFYRMYMGNSIGAAAARISFLLGLTGPSIATESGCSSAMVAVHLACRSLQQGETNLALACGVNLLLHPFDKDVMPMVVSPDGHCKTFDAKADGFARGEGCGVLVLKRLSDAVKDGDNIWGLIRGSGISQEGVSKSMGTPTIHCESLAMEQALLDARLEPGQVSYVEAHGTGTVVGDPMEVSAIAKAYHSDKRKEPLLIGSVKTNVGHTESCSGITGIMKIVLAMHHEMIPPHRNFETLNPSIDLDAVPARIPLEPVPWLRASGHQRFAGVSSFGITGTDAHAIIQEAPEIPSKKLTSLQRPLHLFKISAKTEEALEILMERYQNKLHESADKFCDIAYTANIGRANFKHRAVILAKSNENAASIISQNLFSRGETISENGSKICFLFTGQGSQYPGMGKQLYETSPVFRMHFDYCDNILREKYHICIKDVMWSGNCNEISRTIYSQTSIFCLEYALLKLWESWGIKPDYALGHSLGEFSAAVCAGILNVEDAIKLVAERSRLIDKLPGGKMLVIKADKVTVEIMQKKFAGMDTSKLLDIAATNSLQQTVVAGDSGVVEEFSGFCSVNNIKSIILEATHAFHSKHMNPILKEYRKVAETVTNLKSRKCKYISGMKGVLTAAENVDADYWVEHTRDKVNFLEASKIAVEEGCHIFIEVGPQPVLSALTMMNNETNLTCLPSLKKSEDEWAILLTSLEKLYLNGVTIDWEGFDQFYARKKVHLPHYPFIGKKYWPDMMAISGTTIHPLVGSCISNASPIKLFQSGLNLQSLEYIKDHAIGENIIFPGACYLEMCLAGGLATIENSTDTLPTPSRAMKIENLYIEAPLAMEGSKSCQLQSLLELNSSPDSTDWNDISVKIFHRLESSSGTKWMSHAKATFCPLLTCQDKQTQFDDSSFQKILLTPPDEKTIPELYGKIASTGLLFGETFQSLEKSWRSEDGSILWAKLKSLKEEARHSQYILHPIILDAMIQSTLLFKLTENFKKKLYVPIKVGKFVWLAKPDPHEDLYIHVLEKAELPLGDSLTSHCTATLVTSEGLILAVMSGVEVIDTTVKSLESILEQQVSSMPDLWEEVWRGKVGPLQYRHNAKDKFYTEEFRNELLQVYNDPEPHLMKTFGQLEKFVYLNMLRGLYECGWDPLPGKVFKEDELFHELKINPEYLKYFGFILDVLEEEGSLQKEGDTWRVLEYGLKLEETLKMLASPVFTKELVASFEGTLLLGKVGENLSGILKGKNSALSVLFPEEKQGYPSAAQFYTDIGKTFHLEEMLSKIGTQWLSDIRSKMKGEKFVIRILEIGAGTGSYARILMKLLEDTDTEFEYTYTDISPAFFPAAEKMFEKHLKHLKFKKLNIEEDPIAQGFCPEYYDYICAGDVIHATKSICQTLANVRILLKPERTFAMLEMTRVNRFNTYLFGLLEGFWRFEDFHLRPKHCTLTKGGWARVFEASGFNVIGVFPAVKDYHSYISVQKTKDNFGISPPKTSSKCWILFHQHDAPLSGYLKERILSVNRNLVVVQAGDRFMEVSASTYEVRRDILKDFEMMIKSVNKMYEVEGILYCWALDKKATSQEDLLQPYFHMAKSISSLKQSSNPRLVTVTRGVAPLEGNDLSHFHASTLWGFTKAFKNEIGEMRCRCVDVADDIVDETRMEEVFHELWNVEKEAQVAYQSGTRYIPKFQAYKPSINDLPLPPGTDRFQLILPETKAIADLAFGPLDHYNLEGNEVEIQVKASALNFRDVFSVLKPSEKFKDVNAVGFDFAGVIKRVGLEVKSWNVNDLVFGVNVNGAALPSHIKLNKQDILPVPPGMTLCEAATLPAVFATAYYCLIDIAKIQSSDVVLVHTASGGVGLSAIEICKYFGATVIATAGSKRKQNYLRSLGIQHVFHSRKTDYGDEILQVTNGRGVNIVLNSLTSEGFKEATLKACAEGARFVEMSKLSIWEVEEVKRLRPDVDYTIADVSSLEISEWRRLMNSLNDLSEKKVVSPIPYVRFDGLNIREALQYLQKAKHIGKVVCVMPEVRKEAGEMKIFTPMFNDRSSYLITGGLGGIGFEVCKWMVDKGAKYIILAGRNPPSCTIQQGINQLNSKGASVTPVQMDIGNFQDCKNLLSNFIPNLDFPPLRGIMHAAGTLADGLITNQEWTKLSSTFTTKVNGTLNLHQLTSSMKLEHFVLFSSIAALFGTPGQTNHAAGNCFEDAFTHYRNSMGLPATTVNWGQWGQVGVATEIDLPGLKTLSNLQGINALEHILKSQRTQTAVLNMESFLLFSKFLPSVADYLDERIWKSSSAPRNFTVKSNEFWERYESKEDREEKLEILKSQLRSILRNILKLDDIDGIDDSGNLQEMGVDSLMFVEIKNSLQALLGERVVVNATALRDCHNINLLSEQLVGIIEGESGNEIDASPPTKEEVISLLREDCHLPENISRREGQQAKNSKDIKTVLITGCTGTLGLYILKELTKLPQLTQVYCLLRRHKTKSAEERLLSVLKSRKLVAEVDMSKIVCIHGNVASPHLGMEVEKWEQLSQNVDAVFHCAAAVLHTEYYQKKNSKTDSRAVNIGGTKNVLEFACEKSLKQVFYCSALIATATTNKSGCISEDWPNLEDYDGITLFAYPNTKFVGDILVKEAVQRGIPCKAFRFPFVVGESKSGRFTVEGNHLMLRYLFILKHGIIPANPFPVNCLPVDVCAYWSVKLFFHEGASSSSDIYNLIHSHPDTDQGFIDVAKRFGIQVEPVELSEFSKKVQDSVSDNSAYSVFSDFYRDDADLLNIVTSVPSLNKWLEGNEQFWRSLKISKIMPEFFSGLERTVEYIHSDLLYCKEEGWFDKFGL